MIDFTCADIVAWARAYTGPKFHGVLCDPPYELGFMGKSWDSSGVAFQPDTWEAIGACLVPGAHLLAFGGTRTQHRLVCAIEDAGFEIRDCLMFLYGSGFPKSLDVSKAIDRAAGAEREVVGIGQYAGRGRRTDNTVYGQATPSDAETITAPATPAAREWAGYGTALKPAWEPCIVARWPLAGTVAANCLEHGAGALNIAGCRVGTEQTVTRRNGDSGGNGAYGRDTRIFERINPTGRWPANLLHDGSAEVLAGFPQTGLSSGGTKHATPKFANQGGGDGWRSAPVDAENGFGYGDTGSAARFFYTAKASRRERDAGLEGFEAGRAQKYGSIRQNRGAGYDEASRAHNKHPTVKPLSLCEYLARLILPPPCVAPRRILVPFAGSGSEAIGAMRAGWDEIVGVELSQEYVDIASARAAYWAGELMERAA